MISTNNYKQLFLVFSTGILQKDRDWRLGV